MVINSELHVVGGFSCDPHIIWNRDARKYTIIIDPLVNMHHTQKTLVIRRRDDVYNLHDEDKSKWINMKILHEIDPD